MSALESVPRSELETVIELLERIRYRHNPHVDERLVRERETWHDAGHALRLLRAETGEEEA